jgi:hypothetical protein
VGTARGASAGAPFQSTETSQHLTQEITDMQLPTTLRRTASLAALTTVTGSAALAGTASAATISKAEVLTPGARIPVNFAGYTEPANKRLPANHRIVAAKATVERDERPTTVLTAPKGFELVTIGHREGGDLAPQITHDFDYVGKRSVRVTLVVNRNEVSAGETAEDTVYALARRA